MPKRSHDLAFKGTMWITADGYALRRIDAVASADANINFVTDLRVFQDLTPPTQGPGLPTRTRLVFGIKPYDGQASMRVRLSVLNSDFVRNQPHEGGFLRRARERGGSGPATMCRPMGCWAASATTAAPPRATSTCTAPTP